MDDVKTSRLCDSEHLSDDEVVVLKELVTVSTVPEVTI
jgi:hypothetical protein